MARKPKRRTHGSGSIVQRGASWLVRFREGGKRKVKSFTTRELAERTLAKIMGQIAVQEAGLPPDPKGIPQLAALFTPWIAKREHTHRSWRDDRSRWNAHIGPAFGALRPVEVTPDAIGAFVDAKLAAGVSSTTVGHCVRILSTFMSDLGEDPRNGCQINPVRMVRKAVKKKFRVRKHDAPFIEKLGDIRRVYLALTEPYNVMFAAGVMLGLRTSEMIGLDWSHVDLTARRVRVTQQVQDGELVPLKDEDPRSVPIQDDLLPILTSWKLRTGGAGLLFTPKHPARGGRPDLGRPARFVRDNTMNAQLRKAFAKLGLAPMGWRNATRTTVARPRGPKDDPAVCPTQG